MKNSAILSILFILMILACRAAASANPTLAVVNRGDSTLSIIDAATMKTMATVPTGESPHEVVITQDGKLAIVSNYGSQKAGSSLSIIDLETQKEIKRLDLSPMLRPHGLVEISGNVYFTAEVNNLVGRYNLATEKVDWLIGTGQTASHMLVVTPDQKRIYTANVASDTVTAIAFGNVPPAGSKITHIPVGKQPEAIDISPDGKEVWVGLNVDKTIEIIDTAGYTVLEKLELGERPYRLRFTPDGKSLVATMPGTQELIVFDAKTRKETKRIKTEGAPLGIIISKDGKSAFVSIAEPGMVIKIDLEKGDIVSSVNVGKIPDGIDVSEN